MRHHIGTKTSCEELAALADRLLGYPRKGRYASGEREMSDTPGSIGWTMRYAEVRRHPRRSRWAYPIDDEIVEAMADERKRGRINASERGKMERAEAGAKVLPGSWEAEA